MRGTAKRALTIFLAVFFCVPSVALAAPVFDTPMRAVLSEITLDHTRSILTQTLETYTSTMAKGQGARMGDWYLHANGFAFHIPEEMELMEGYRGTTVLLVDKTGQSSAFRTSISISITNSDDHLLSITERSIKSAYASSFDRFSLISLSPADMYGTSGWILTFYAGSSPRVFYQQHLFIRDGYSYIITLTAADNIGSLFSAWKQSEILLDSLVFAMENG